MRVLLLSTYELGRQPFGLASPAAWLRRAGCEVRVVDLARGRLDDETVAWADVAAFYLPMHTATRLAVPVIKRVHASNPRARLVAYGLYAPLNEALLASLGVDTVLGPEFEADLVDVATGAPPPSPGAPHLPRLAFIAPDRAGLPPLGRYASLQWPDGTRRIVGATEASRGCRHLCRHCPIVPVYNGQFRVVPVDVVLADIRAQVAAGAEHMTFGDPDFFNGPTHARRIVEAMAREWPGLTYDVVIKIEHLLRHAPLVPVLRETGCAFVTSAVESVDDATLSRLEKGHTRADFERAAALMRAEGVALVPTFVPFMPWTTLGGYLELLDAVDDLDLVEHVAPIQLAIRLLIPDGSRLLELDDIRRIVSAFDPATLAHPWAHPDAEVDRLHHDVLGLVGRRLSAPRREVFDAVRALTRERIGLPVRAIPETPRMARAAVPYLNEPWYC